jgi:hypothetical protein
MLLVLLISLAAHAEDPAAVARQLISERVREFPNLRARAKLAVWENDPAAVWEVIPEERACLARLDAEGVPYVRAPRPSALVPTPVRITGEIGGVSYGRIVVSCELARKLPAFSALLRAHGIDEVEVMSAYRDHPRTSFHTMGLALDVAAFRRRGAAAYVVARDFEIDRRAETCARSDFLRRLACDLFAARIFSSVITPNYNAGHRDHFHLDARPGDERFFIR